MAKFLLDSNIISEPSKPIPLDSVGSPSPYADTQIASIALANNLTLVTRNVDDFSNIANKFSLQIENWFM